MALRTVRQIRAFRGSRIPARREVCLMKIKREVWAEFGDGSVAAYGVKDDELQALLDQLCGVGIPCAIWVDGRPWTRHGQSEYDDGVGGGDGRSA